MCHQYTCVLSHMHTLLTLTLPTHLIDVGMCFEGCIKSRVSHCFAQHVLHDNQKVHISQRLLHPWVLQPHRAVQQLTTVPYCHTMYSSTSYSISLSPPSPPPSQHTHPTLIFTLTLPPNLTVHTSHPHLHSHPPPTSQYTHPTLTFTLTLPPHTSHMNGHSTHAQKHTLSYAK